MIPPPSPWETLAFGGLVLALVGLALLASGAAS